MSNNLVLKIRGHLVVDDGCDVTLEKSTVIAEDESGRIARKAHQRSIEQQEHKPTTERHKHLLYLNQLLADAILGDGESIKIQCPVCNKVYTITSDMYSALKNGASE